MYYSDVSCNPQNSLPEMDRLGIRAIVPIDWMALITVTARRVSIDGQMAFGGVDPAQVEEYLAARGPEMLKAEGCWTDACTLGGRLHHVLLVPIRSHDYYKVFFACLNAGQAYSGQNVHTASIFCKLMYENVLLNNKIIQEKEYLQNVLDSTEALIISTNLDGDITTANKAAVKFLGGGNVIGRRISEMTSGLELSLINRVATENRSKYFKEVFLARSRGRKTVFNLSASPLHDSKKQVVGVVLIATDITARKILERQLDELKQFAALGEIAAGVAHDIKNPLMSIRGCSRLLQKELADRPEYGKLVEPIIREVDRINEVVEQMISYGHIGQETNHALIDVNEVLENSLNVVHFHKGSKYISVQKELAADLPFVRGYNVQLQQAFINLLINAVQAIEQEGVIRIRSGYDKNRKCVRVSIADNGKGIATKELRKVFRPFYTTKKSGEGGLGLSIVNRVVKEHCGKVTITSKLRQGTNIEVYLPC